MSRNQQFNLYHVQYQLQQIPCTLLTIQLEEFFNVICRHVNLYFVYMW